MTDTSSTPKAKAAPAPEPKPNDWVTITHPSSQGKTAQTSRQSFDEYWSHKGWTEVTEGTQPEQEFKEEGWE